MRIVPRAIATDRERTLTTTGNLFNQAKIDISPALIVVMQVEFRIRRQSAPDVTPHLQTYQLEAQPS
ncbi:MAG: hypothetical protein AAF978_08335, partial [Cyanobacteria bacterium P01_E01_bin.48]